MRKGGLAVNKWRYRRFERFRLTDQDEVTALVRRILKLLLPDETVSICLNNICEYFEDTGIFKIIDDGPNCFSISPNPEHQVVPAVEFLVVTSEGVRIYKVTLNEFLLVRNESFELDFDEDTQSSMVRSAKD